MINLPNAELSKYTTFQLGGPCKILITSQTPDELREAVLYLKNEQQPFLLIGGGSNLVVSDEGLDLAVIRYISESPIIERDGNSIVVSGSTELDALAMYCVNEGLEGLNYTTGIPGTVGGAVVGNAGAWGKQVGDVVESVTIIPRGRSGVTPPLHNKDCSFSYRHSHLKETGDIVVSVRFDLKPGDCVTLAQERAEILKKRAEKHPDLKTHPCAGSFFRNVEPTSKAERRQAAGWFLEEAGGKNLSVGGAHIFDKHANIIVKGQNCTAQDVFDLSEEMIKIVKTKFNFKLQREVRFVGKFKIDNQIINKKFW